MGCAAQKENEAKIYDSSGKEKQLRHGMEDLHCKLLLSLSFLSSDSILETKGNVKR
jgi:hypothetical protein